MNCPFCADEVPDGSKYCNHCSGELAAKPKPRVVSRVVIVAVAVLMGFLLLRVGLETHQALAKPAPQRHEIKVIDAAAAVDARATSYYTFSVPPNATQVSVTGHFTATGGGGNDIDCFLLDEDGLANFKNGHPANVFFNSGKVTQAKIAAALPSTPGTYYLVLDNRFSFLTPKAVQVTATISYMQ